MVLLMLSGVVASQEASDLVNLDHLRFLTEPVTVNGEEMAVVHIYSEYPDYEWVDAAGEGLSAVDDVARAAVVYLWQYERTGDESLLELARLCLNFVRYMQADDGEFYNFVTDKQGTINRRGGTSFKSLGWWAMRGLWALGEGVRVFDKVDQAYADRLAEAYLRTEAALGDTLGNYGEFIERHGFRIPAWIPGGEPAVASVGLLGLAAYQQARPNDTTADIITKIADSVSQYRLGEDSVYPFNMHPVSANAPGFWHDWGAHMTHALVVAGMTLDRPDWIQSAAESADSFLLRQLAFERFRHIGVVPYRLEQIAYGTNMLVQTYAALYQATGEERYARYAGLAGSWYFGNNMAGVPMYDPATGRTLDGINGPVAWRVNRNSGAESTIEGLMSLIALADIPAAVELLRVQTVEGNSWLVLEAENGERVVGTPTYFSVNWTGEGYVSGGRYVGIGEGQRMRLVFELTPEQANEEYLVYVAHLRQAKNSGANLIQRVDTAPVIDGSGADWPADLPVLESNTARQFLRGAGLWQGADVDSHRVTLAWDDTNLYMLVDVRDPEHVQTATLSNVWQGDTLWIYVTSDPNARRLSAKFTLAQTPDGPQVWDWVSTGFLRGAALAWQATEGGYTYEAAIPWSSLDVEQPAAGQQIGFEAGRGIGGNSFMDLTGRDPDVPANLLTLMLAEPGMDAAAGVTPAVALDVRLNDGETITLPESVSPDSDYFWLDLLTPQPVKLNAGENVIRYRYAGESGDNPGLSKIDAFYIQPVTARRVFQHPDGRTITLTYNTLTGRATWDDHAP
ncbi:MAG: hypothetical protein HZC41_00905 [Chloroflexi bacterium]|nr:hypothetical protein [Chloroflexota bacterium]